MTVRGAIGFLCHTALDHATDEESRQAAMSAVAVVGQALGITDIADRAKTIAFSLMHLNQAEYDLNQAINREVEPAIVHRN